MKSSDFDWSALNDALLSCDGEGGVFVLFGAFVPRGNVDA